MSNYYKMTWTSSIHNINYVLHCGTERTMYSQYFTNNNTLHCGTNDT